MKLHFLNVYIQSRESDRKQMELNTIYFIINVDAFCFLYCAIYLKIDEFNQILERFDLTKNIMLSFYQLGLKYINIVICSILLNIELRLPVYKFNYLYCGFT